MNLIQLVIQYINLILYDVSIPIIIIIINVNVPLLYNIIMY